MESDKYIVAAGNREIWVINPNSKQKFRLRAKETSQLFDIYTSNSGVYHASELIKKEYKKISGIPKGFDVNYVQVIDSMSGRPCLTLTPPESETLPLEKRLIKITFQFQKQDNSLLYVLNNSQGVIFPNFNGDVVQSGKTNYNGKELFYDEKKVATLDEEIKYVKEVDANKFAKGFRIKNKERYMKNRAFFK